MKTTTIKPPPRHVGRSLYIASDEYQYIIKEKIVVQKGENKGKEHFKDVAFPTTLDRAIDWLAEKVGRENINTDIFIIKTYLDEFKAGLRELSNSGELPIRKYSN